jgi:hypothetical protein
MYPYPPPYQQPPYQQPPPPKKDNTVLIVLLVVGALVVVLIGIPLVAGIIIGFTRASRAHATYSPSYAPYAAYTSTAGTPGLTTTTRATATLSETSVTTNGLLKIHYPTDFAVKALDSSTLIVSRNFGGGEDEVVTFGAVDNPITDNVHEFGRILLAAIEKNVHAKGGTFSKGGDTPAMCLGKYAGVEVESTFTLPPVPVYTSKSCFFFRGTRGYEVRYDVPNYRSTVEVPLLVEIEEATELVP